MVKLFGHQEVADCLVSYAHQTTCSETKGGSQWR
jgi:hypothetical protein